MRVCAALHLVERLFSISWLKFHFRTFSFIIYSTYFFTIIFHYKQNVFVYTMKNAKLNESLFKLNATYYTKKILSRVRRLHIMKSVVVFMSLKGQIS